MQMLLDLMEERQRWLGRRDEAIREISRLSELVRATMNMVPADQLARYEPIFERIEQRPVGLSLAIRACFTANATGTGFLPYGWRRAETGKPFAGEAIPEDTWLTPVEIRDALKRMGFPFENYKANPLASIHTTLKRMVPAELEVKTLKDGRKVYRLKSAGEWSRAFAEARDWLRSNYTEHSAGGNVIGVKRRSEEKPPPAEQQDEQENEPSKGKKRGTSGGA